MSIYIINVNYKTRIMAVLYFAALYKMILDYLCKYANMQIYKRINISHKL